MKKSLLASLVDGICNFLCEPEEETQPKEHEAIVPPDRYVTGDIVHILPCFLREWRYNTREETYVVWHDFGEKVRVHIFKDIFSISEEDIPRRYLGLVRHEKYPRAYAVKTNEKDYYRIEIKVPTTASVTVDFFNANSNWKRSDLLHSVVKALRTIPRDFREYS